MSVEKEQIKIYGVGEITNAIRSALSQFTKIYVEGEISGWKISSLGHAYFTLKGEDAQLPCAMFASSIAKCRAAPRLRDGVKVCVYGRIDVYAANGRYQMIVQAAKVAGEGDLMARFNELKERLQKEGLFDPGKKRKLPFLPHRIGVVTSPTGAVIHDMCTVLIRRFPNIEIRLYPVKVQGAGSKEEIVEGIRFFNREESDWVPDVLIVGRGGGSVEDLWSFNEECVVRAVAESKIPTISAVGHQTDFTLCDFAADIRAGTPSIAAEIAVPVKEKLLNQINNLSERLKFAPERAVDVFAQRLDYFEEKLSSSLKNAVAAAEMRLSKSSQRLVPVIKDALVEAEKRLLSSDQKLMPAMKDAFSKSEHRLIASDAKLNLLDPFNPLKRGYSLTVSEDGAIVRSVESVKPGDILCTRFADGEISSKVC
jgi:exodeoxyribonuclease VII large subunit